MTVQSIRSHRLFPWFASFACALLNIAIFPKLEWSWLAFVCFIPLLAVVETGKVKALFIFGWLSGFLFHLGNLYWIYYVIQHYSSLPPVLCVGILLLLCIVLALFWGIFLALCGVLRDRRGLTTALLVAPLLWIVLEWMRNHTTEFPWCLLGYSQYNHLRVAQLASFYRCLWTLLAADEHQCRSCYVYNITKIILSDSRNTACCWL